jgi:tellurite resistance protein
MTLEDHPVIVVGQPLSESAFYMWRCIVAVAHADGMVQDQELEYLNQVFAGMEKDSALTAEQRQTLGEDLVTPQNIGTLLPHVTDHADHQHLVYTAALMAEANGELDPGEEEIIKRVAAGEMSDADLKQLLEDIRKTLADRAMKEALARAYAERPRGLRAIVRMVLNRIYAK